MNNHDDFENFVEVHNTYETEVSDAIISSEALSAILTAEFQVKGFIPNNFNLEILEMEVNPEGLLLRVNIHKEYIN